MPSLRFRSFFKLATLIALGTLGMQPLIANAQPKPTSTNSEQLARQFRDGFMKGCIIGKVPNVRNVSGYCNCLADSYLKRYNGITLSAISQLASSLGEKGPLLVNIMITPEANVCAARN